MYQIRILRPKNWKILGPTAPPRPFPKWDRTPLPYSTHIPFSARGPRKYTFKHPGHVPLWQKAETVWDSLRLWWLLWNQQSRNRRPEWSVHPLTSPIMPYRILILIIRTTKPPVHQTATFIDANNNSKLKTNYAPTYYAYTIGSYILGTNLHVLLLLYWHPGISFAKVINRLQMTLRETLKFMSVFANSQNYGACRSSNGGRPSRCGSPHILYRPS